MKVALIADIHGNSAALDSALADIDSMGVSQILVAGDLVGYYYNPESVLNSLNARLWHGVRGNHEDMLVDWLNGKGQHEVRKKYGSGIQVAVETLSKSSIDQLASLPPSRSLNIEGRSVLLCHGSPLKTDEYVYPNASIDARSSLVSPTHDLVVYGHTHHPVVWEDTGKMIVNPGSIGQQRNGVLGAHWALWETESHSISFQVSPYASSELINECRMRDPQLPYLADVLKRVRQDHNV